jgi:hypothetical protein
MESCYLKMMSKFSMPGGVQPVYFANPDLNCSAALWPGLVSSGRRPSLGIKLAQRDALRKLCESASMAQSIQFRLETRFLRDHRNLSSNLEESLRAVLIPGASNVP